MRLMTTWLASAVLGLFVAAALSAAENPRDKEPVSWDVRLAAPDEPGEPFEMWGTVRDAQGKLLPGTKLFVYHADTKGRYALNSDAPLRLAATLRTDQQARYRIRSVFPGTYGFPAHIHYEFLSPKLGSSQVELRRKGSDGPSRAVEVPSERGVWRLNVNLFPSEARVPELTTGARRDSRSQAALDSANWQAAPSSRDSVPAPR